MPLYVADYLADTRRLSTLEHGAYMLLIMEYWRNEGIPTDDKKLARIVGLTFDEWMDIREEMADLFQDGWKHKRIDEELKRSNDRSYAAKAKADRRWRIKADAGADADACADVEAEAYADAIPEHYSGNAISQSQSQPLDNRDANASLVASATVSQLKIERDRKRLSEDMAKLHLLGCDWNSMASAIGLPQIDGIAPGSPREKSALARIREGCDFAAAFTKIRASPFLRGERGSFRCTFKWIINSTNFENTMEGNYDEVPKDQQRPKQYYAAQR